MPIQERGTRPSTRATPAFERGAQTSGCKRAQDETAILAGRPWGRYRLMRILGRGGMGLVWQAWDAELDRVVALKQLHSVGPLEPQQTERFLREIRLTARLRHPVIVRLLDAGVHEGRPYYTSEYVVGRSLDFIRLEPVPIERWVEWIRAIAEALHYAHEQGIVHRDVKPGNILIDESGRPHLVDFGLACEHAGRRPYSSRTGRPLTDSGILVGTPEYMSPEQARGRLAEIGPASDQFSLGVVLYEAMTGLSPFSGDGLLDRLRRVMEADPVRPRRIDPRLPRDLETICLRALEKRSERRYPSLRELAADLARYEGGEPIAARPSVWAMRMVRKAARRPALWGPYLVLAVLGVAVAAWTCAAQVARERAVADRLAEGRRRLDLGETLEARDAFHEADRLAPGCADARTGFAQADELVRRQLRAR